MVISNHWRLESVCVGQHRKKRIFDQASVWVSASCSLVVAGHNDHKLRSSYARNSAPLANNSDRKISELSVALGIGGLDLTPFSSQSLKSLFERLNHAIQGII